MTGRTSFISWMKALGMLVIVWGHVAGFGALMVLRPIYIKQFGVAFFIFLTAFTIAYERRGSVEITFRRLFPVYIVGAGAALFLSAVTFATIGTLQKSNYLPFVGGVNVLIDAFPANPTTWYLGAYLHVVIAAVLLRRARVGFAIVLLCAAAEITCRAALMTTGRLFVTYMILPNWTTVLVLGFALSQENPRRPLRALIGGLVVTGAALAIRPDTLSTFPFTMPREPGWANLLRDSAAITGLYSGVTAVAYGLFAGFHIASGAIVDWIAEHTLMVFILHMPLFYILPLWLTAPHNSLTFAVLRTVVCLVLPILVSMGVNRVVDLGKTRDAAWRALRRSRETQAA
jgi:hypothetical protein